jgi:hypothetical protein
VRGERWCGRVNGLGRQAHARDGQRSVLILCLSVTVSVIP